MSPRSGPATSGEGASTPAVTADPTVKPAANPPKATGETGTDTSAQAPIWERLKAPGGPRPSVWERLGFRQNATTVEDNPEAAPAPTSPDTGKPNPATMPAVAAGAAVAVGAATAKAKTDQPATLAAAQPKVGVARRTRKARLRLSRLDPWSVMKTAFLFSIAAGIMMVVAVYGLWTVIGASGLFDSLNEIVGLVVASPGDTTPFLVEQYVNTQKVMGVTAILAVFDVVIFTALATLGSFLYNLAATMLGGLEVTLAED